MSTTTENQTAVASIEETIRAGLSRNGGSGYYDSYARPIVASLVEREQEIAERLITVAAEADIDEDQARDMIRTTGLSIKDPEPEVVETEDEEDDAELTDEAIARSLREINQALTGLTTTVSGLAEFARRNGYRS